jgi:hypothetical protein
MPPAKRARAATGRGAVATSTPTGRGRVHVKSESSERDNHDASSSQQVRCVPWALRVLCCRLPHSQPDASAVLLLARALPTLLVWWRLSVLQTWH